MSRAKPEAVAIGGRIRSAIDESGLSVREVAAAADLSLNWLYVLMRGEAMPSLPTLGRLAKVLGVTRDWLEGVPGARRRPRNGRKS